MLENLNMMSVAKGEGKAHALTARGLAVSSTDTQIKAVATTINDNVCKNDRKRAIYLDTSDLIEYVKYNNTVSGIQRVVVNLIEHAPAIAALYNVDVIFVFPEYHSSRIFSIDRAAINQLIEALDDAGRSRVALELAIGAVYKSRKIVMPLSGDIFTIAGAFWTYDNYDILLRLRQRGVGVINFIHDLIQISHPEFVFEAATRQFRGALIDILASSTALLTNSEYVADDVRRFMLLRTDVDIPVQAVPLATELAPRREDTATLSPDIVAVLATPYVLSVSTIEIRKNHKFMVKVWERLIEQGINDLPDLVFVGKVGWDIGPFIEDLEKTNFLNGKIKILTRVSDGELAALYRGARFTMYMSFVEGFGLPVAESLAYGVPCIASNRSSMPEAGGALARYLDPDDIGGGVQLVRDLVENREELEAWRQAIARDFRARPWKQFAADYVAGLLACAEADGRLYNNRFRAGEIYGMGRWEILRRDASGQQLIYLANARHYGWHANEEWGCWSASRKAAIRLATDLEAGTRILLYVLVRAPGHLQVIELSAQVEDQVTHLGTISTHSVWKSFVCEVGVGGEVALTLIVEGPKPHVADSRDLYVGCLGLAFCPANAMDMRLGILEAITLDPQRMSEPPHKLRPRFDSHIELVSDRVDAEWYLEQYPDVQLLDMSADEHFEWIGKRLGRKPNAMASLVSTG